MKVQKTQLDDVLLITPDIFEDHRGQYVETFNERDYVANVHPGIEFVQDDISVSTKNVLRGIHGDADTWKLISCLYGSFYLVVVNCNESSPNFGKWQGFTMTDRTYQQVLVPPRYGNGHLVLSDKTIFHYKQTTYYNRAGQFTYRYDEPKFNIWWPVKNPILSLRDERGA